MMQPKLAHRDESAWAAGDLAYDLDDTLEMGIIKAANAGIKPCSTGYAAFITAFSRRVRSKQVSPQKLRQLVDNPVQNHSAKSDPAQNDSAIILTPDFSRIAS